MNAPGTKAAYSPLYSGFKAFAPITKTSMPAMPSATSSVPAPAPMPTAPMSAYPMHRSSEDKTQAVTPAALPPTPQATQQTPWFSTPTMAAMSAPPPTSWQQTGYAEPAPQPSYQQPQQQAANQQSWMQQPMYSPFSPFSFMQQQSPYSAYGQQHSFSPFGGGGGGIYGVPDWLLGAIVSQFANPRMMRRMGYF